jgi:ubiquinone/menaquinone biosynthesis C-methylase UbiE
MGEAEVLYAREYFLAIAGLAMARTCLQSPASARPRVDDIRRVIEHFDEFPQSLELKMHEHDVEPGYTRWAPHYDGPNPAIEAEQPVVHDILDGAPRGVALDAACGTGRHAAYLASLGDDVIGVDLTDAMLDIARAKVPQGEFRKGRLEALPLDDASVDTVVCSLALTHVPDLGPVYREFARVLRPGGWVVTSDMHPVNNVVGGGAAVFPSDEQWYLPYVVNRVHGIADYVDALQRAGLTVMRCVEPRFPEAAVQRAPSYAVYPDATRQAFLDLPYILVWVAAKPTG